MGHHRNEYGVLMPHFGSQASRERVIDSAVFLEEAGFDSIWVRDHLVFRPHKSEDQDRTFLDPFVVMSAIAAVTKRIKLATGSLIPHRNPVHTALLVGSLDYIAGPDRIILGYGLGSFDHEFAVAGMDGWDRKKVVPETVEILRLLWEGEEADFEGDFFTFEATDVHPVPQGEVPIWYCGSSSAAARRAVEYCDGWIPGRMPRRDFVKRMERMRRLSEEAGRRPPDTGTIPYTVPAETTDEAMAVLDMPKISHDVGRRYDLPDDQDPHDIRTLDGAVIAGDPDTVIEEIRRCQEAGAKHFVFDLRLVFDRFEDKIQLIADEILPKLKAGDSA